MKSEVKRVGKHQLEITVTIPTSRVGGVLEKVFDEAAQEIEIKGFRKGQAPKNLAREKIDKAKAHGEVINRLVPEAYNATVKEHLLKPIISPRIELIQFEPEENQDFIFKAITAERPEVTLGDYQSELKKLKPPSSPSTPSTPSLGKVLRAVLSAAPVEIPKILTEDEVSRMLSRLIDQTAHLGLTVEQYLQSQGKTVEQLRAEYAKQAEENLKAELVFEEIAQKEKIEITDKEIEEAINAAPDEESKRELAKEGNKWYIRSVLKRNKTLQRLLELAK